MLHSIRTIHLFTFGLLVLLVGCLDPIYVGNFEENNELTEWNEHSDTIKEAGKSKAVLVSHKTVNFKGAVLFTLLNPQPCGAAFAGVRKSLHLDLTQYNRILLRVRGQGSYNGYKMVFREEAKNYSFCNFFKANDQYEVVELNLNDFKPYQEGKALEDPGIKLDVSKIISVDLQAYGGAHLPVKQAGAASLEIEWIRTD